MTEQHFVERFIASAENRYWFEIEHPELDPKSKEFEAALKAEAIACFNFGKEKKAIALSKQPPF